MSNARDFWAEYLAQETARGRRAAQDLPFKLVETSGEAALDTWRLLSARKDGAPIVLGGPGDLYRIADRMSVMRERGDTPEGVLAAAHRLSFPDDIFRDGAA